MASGLAIASAALLSPAVFAQVINPGATPASKVGALDGEILPVFTLTWTPGNATFTIPTTGLISAQSLGTLGATGTVAYKIIGVSTQDGALLGADGNQRIPYTLNFNNGPNITPSLAAFDVTTGAANVPISGATLSLSSLAVSPLDPQHYTDTLTLTTVDNR